MRDSTLRPLSFSSTMPALQGTSAVCGAFGQCLTYLLSVTACTHILSHAVGMTALNDPPLQNGGNMRCAREMLRQQRVCK